MIKQQGENQTSGTTSFLMQQDYCTTGRKQLIIQKKKYFLALDNTLLSNSLKCLDIRAAGTYYKIMCTIKMEK